MTVTIRALEAGDRTQWTSLWCAYQTFYRVCLTEAVTETTWQRILSPQEPVRGLGAFDDGRLVGIAHFLFHRSTWMTADTCYLQDLFVVPEARGRGFARALIESVYREADLAAAGQVYWLTHETNAAGRALYDRLATNAGFIAYERHAEASGD